MILRETIPASKRIRYSFAHVPEVMLMPSLIELQKRSYEEFLQKDIPALERKNVGLQAALLALFPVQDFAGRVSLEFEGYTLEEPKYDLVEARQKGLTYAAPLRAKLRLVIWEDTNGERSIKYLREQEVYFGDIPLMTDEGTFIINGVERVVVSQMHRSPGVFFDHDRGQHASGKYLFFARVIPLQGSWLDFEFDAKDLLCVRIDRKRKLLVTTLLMALESGLVEEGEESSGILPGMSKEEILQTFYETISYTYHEDQWRIPFKQNMWLGMRLEADLIDADTGKVVAQREEKLGARSIKKWQEEGLKSVYVPYEHIVGRYLAQDLVDEETGEIYAEAGEEVSLVLLETLLKKKITLIQTLDIDYVNTGPYLRNTLMAEKNTTRAEALFEIYRVLRPGETPTVENAISFFHNLFFNPGRYDLSDVGRVKINARLGLNTDPSVHILEKRDIIEIVRYLLELKQGRGYVDDIDSLANRRVRSVGELLEAQYRSGLTRMQRGIRERMVVADLETAMPNDLLNARPLSAIIREFFGTSQLSQFMDQANPLSEVNHKRRLSALGPGGLTRDRAGIEVRDVHPTHYGKICPVETPEGANIGLISSLAIYARINNYGFLETPYRRIVDARLTDEVVYVSAMEEEKYAIAQADINVDVQGYLIDELVECRYAGDYILVSPKEVQFADVSPKQIMSVAAALIPFVEHDDANRALMGSNMQRQAVPLLVSEAPLVGTGIEGIVARDSGVIIRARRSGVVDQVEATRIVVRPDDVISEGGVVDIYNLAKFRKSNAGTCIHQKPLVFVGQRIKADEVIADGAATDLGELALGRNVLVAFMPWKGYGFEDSIILSQRLVIDDVYTSIHIEELEVSARDMKLGYEEITRDIPGVSDEAVRHLDETGVAYIGAEVGPGDILVGKVSPKAEVPLTPEEKLLRAIFSDRASDMKDTSLRVPSGMFGTVVDVRIFSRRGVEKDNRALAIERETIARLAQDRDVERDILNAGFKRTFKEAVMGQMLAQKIGSVPARTLITEEIWDTLSSSVSYRKIQVMDEAVMAKLEAIFDQHEQAIQEVQKHFEKKLEKVHRGDELPAGVLKTVKIYLAIKRKIQPGDKMAGRHGNKGVVSIIVPQEEMPYLADGTPVDMILNPLGLPSRMNVGQILETHLGWAALGLGRKARELLESVAQENADIGEQKLRKGLKQLYQKPQIAQYIEDMGLEELVDLAQRTVRGLPMASPVFEGATTEDIETILSTVDLSRTGQEILYDGRTGEPFDRPITVGVLYMLKLHHLVDEKIHARSVGPYSLVTQQPLGGKAQFGGQRFGEMEVWAMEAYGAARTLQEMLTTKSDDLQGRMKAYKEIIKGNENCEADIPESFNVLTKELKTLGLNVEYLQDAPEISTHREE